MHRRQILHNGTKQGFALVVALTLMAFILLLLLSMVALTRVESQTSQIYKDLSVARNNALLGMQVALGELQKMAGPDQRITTTADILPTLSEPKHRYWTAVWDASGQMPHAPYVSPGRLGWLVSGVDAQGDALQPDANIENPVTLLGSNSVVDPDDEVVVGKVGIPGASGADAGHYAYWVSDEGVKAKINMSDPHREAAVGNGLEARYSLMSSQRNGVERVTLSAGGTKTFGDVLSPFGSSVSQSMEQVGYLDEFGLLNGDSDLVALSRHRRHDLTAVGTGVLANVRDGGLRKDLSLAFEMDLADFNSDPLFAGGGETIPALSEHTVNYLFHMTEFDGSGPTISDPALRGPTWHLLRNYYRLYKTNDPDRNQSYKMGSPLGVEADGSGYRISARPSFPQTRLSFIASRPHSIAEAYYRTGDDMIVNSESTVPRATDMAITPVLLRVQAVMGVQAVEMTAADVSDPADEGKYRIQVQINPIITIWNPYNVALEFETLRVRWRDFNLGFQVETPTETYEAPFSRLRGAGSDKTVIQMDLKSSGSGAPTVLDPGGVRVYSLQNVMPVVAGEEHILLGECYPNTGNLESQMLSNGFLFTSIIMDGGSPEELLVDPGTELAFSIGAETSLIMDSRLLRNLSAGEDDKMVQLGRLWMPSSEKHFRWPSSGTNPVELIRNTLPPEIHPLGMVDTRLKAADADEPVQFLAHYNPRAAGFVRSTGRPGVNSGDDPMIPGNWYFSAKPITNWSGTEVSNVNGNLGSWGDNYESGTSALVMFEIPTLPLQSLAAFQHINNWTAYTQTPAYAVGNSLASPFIPKAQVTHTLVDGSNAYTQADWSYLSNEALWDEYYFSTLTPRMDLGEDDLEDLLGTYLDGAPMPNARMRFDLVGSASGADLAAQLFSGASVAPDAPARITESLMLEGAFNVNSTSVEAWKVVLSSTNAIDVTYATGTGSSATADDQDSPYSRMSLPGGDNNDDWSGFRSLAEAQVDALAEEIVRQVRERGPFVSLADFVNRRLVDDATGRNGALQTAIDATSINDSIISADANPSTGSSVYQAHSSGPIEAGASGYLRQSDLLMTLGPVLSARSDAFTIRAYGDSVDPIGGDTVRAWCEVVVQRKNEFIDPSVAPSAETVNGLNAQFGRRFEILSFRWLDPEQI